MPMTSDLSITHTSSIKDRYIIFKKKLYSRLDSYYDRLFDNYAKFLLKYAWSLLCFSILITIGLTLCLYWAQLIPVDENDLKIKNSPAEYNEHRILNIFGNDAGFRVYQQVKLRPALDIILKRRSTNGSTNMLVKEVIDQMRILDAYIRSSTIVFNNQTYSYPQLCNKEENSHVCSMDGGYLLSDDFYKKFSHMENVKSGIYFDAETGQSGYRSFIFGKNYKIIEEEIISEEDDYVDDEAINITTMIMTKKQKLKEIISYAPLLRLRYNLDAKNGSIEQAVLKWEKLIIENLTLLNDNFSELDIYASVSTIINSEITKYARLDAKSVGIMIIIFFLCTCLWIGIEGNWVTSVGYLPLFGIIGYALSTGAAFGFLTLCKMSLLEPMTMLMLVVAIIDCIRISIICKELHGISNYLSSQLPLSKSSNDDDLIKKRLQQTLKHSELPFFCTTLTLCTLYLLLGLLSQIVSIRIYSSGFCIYLLINYLVHLTFFLSCLTITCKRIDSNRHSLMCFKMNRSNSSSSPSPSSSITNRCHHYFRSIYAKKFGYIICLLSIILFVYSLLTALKIDTRLFDSQFIPQQSRSLRMYMSSLEHDFDIGPTIMFTIPSTLDYRNPIIREKMQKVIEKCRNESITTNFYLIWLETEDLNQLLSSTDNAKSLITPFSTNDILLENQTVKASRFYCQFKTIQGRRSDIITMDNMYRYSRESGLNGLFPYSLVFSHYETLKEIHHELFLLCLLWFHLLLIFTLILFLSIRLTLTITFHYICLLSTLFTCLYLFHSLTINFANTFLLFIIPGIFIDCFIHYAYTYQRKINGENIKTYQCLFGYDRIFLSLLLSLIALIFFQIQSYTFIVLRNTLFYYILLAFLHLNIFFPLWLNLCKSSTNKGVSTTTTQTNQIPITSIDSNGNGVEQTLLTTSNGTLDNSHSYHKNGFIMNEPQKSS